jgi:Spy/CpxP family protein refolding chaperone
LFEERNKLATLITAAKPDTQVIAAQLERIGKHQVELEKEVVQQILLEKDLLDPAQRELFIGGILHRMMGPQHRIIFPPPEGREKENHWKEKTQTEEKP